jgi:LEA14-like dessication related protein
LLFRRLTTNLGFRNKFINRYADELNTRFLSNNVITHIDQIYATIEPEVISHYERWRNDPSLTNIGVNINNISGWVGYHIDQMKIFADNRPSIVKNHILSQFNLPDFHPLTITNTNVSEGSVEVNENLMIQESSWTGDYFQTVPVQLTAIAANGFEFSHWSGDLTSTEETISISIVGAFEVIPNFTESQITDPIVINEINYKSSDDFNADDWVELYNPNSTSIDLSGWKLKDDDDSHVYEIPSETQIEGNSFIVLVKDASDFSDVFPDITNYIGELGFGFGNSDSVRLYNDFGVLQDEVVYDSDDPWSDCAKETGYTLELITADLDNSLPGSWDCINNYGSPNAVNSSSLSSDEDIVTTVKIYPNPVQNTLYIKGVSNQFNLQVFTITGQHILDNPNSTAIDVSQLKQGMYFIKIIEGQKSSYLKFLKN